MIEIFTSLMLGVFSYMDIKYKKISKKSIMISLVCVFCVACIGRGVIPVVEGSMIGFGMCLVAMILPKTMGLGDGLIFILLGSTLYIEEVIAVGAVAFGVAGIVAIIMLTIYKKPAHYELPFIPCIWVAYLGVIVFEKWV